MHKRFVGFTVVELLIIIVIIGILAAIVIVGYGSTKYTANDTAVQQDISKIADALNVYYTDSASYPINQTQFLTLTSATISPDNYASSGAKAMLYCVDTNASNNGKSMAVIAKSLSGTVYYVRDEKPIAEFSGTFPSGNTTTDCQAANSAITTVTAVWIHDNTRADSAGVSAGGWLVNVL